MPPRAGQCRNAARAQLPRACATARPRWGRREVRHPAGLESLSHFPVTLAVHMAGDELVLLMEVIDGALGTTTAVTLGRRVFATAERLLQVWDRPLREVSVLVDDETTPLHGAGSLNPPAPLSIHERFAEVVKTMPDS